MDNWRKNAPPVKPEQAHINPKSLQQLLYNPYYYTPEEKDLKIGDETAKKYCKLNCNN